MVSPADLSPFERQLAAVGVPVGQVWCPGATAAQFERAELAFGRPVPDELRTLWEWHDGVRVRPDGRLWVTF